ncbi:MAG: group 1 truncated hemoglobin [Myxococcales bacterium]|nr:group 1 truncated hemoglobin [Myxococcales bacterium]
MKRSGLMESTYERLGGEWVLRAIINDFVENMLDDPMIGFLFRETDVHRLRDKEFEMTAMFLGADIRYTGRPLRVAHQASQPIFGGQFDRRRQILVEAMREHDVPEDIAAEWIGHVDHLRGVIVL